MVVAIFSSATVNGCASATSYPSGADTSLSVYSPLGRLNTLASPVVVKSCTSLPFSQIWRWAPANCFWVSEAILLIVTVAVWFDWVVELSSELVPLLGVAFSESDFESFELGFPSPLLNCCVCPFKVDTFSAAWVIFADKLTSNSKLVKIIINANKTAFFLVCILPPPFTN